MMIINKDHGLNQIQNTNTKKSIIARFYECIPKTKNAHSINWCLKNDPAFMILHENQFALFGLPVLKQCGKICFDSRRIQ